MRLPQKLLFIIITLVTFHVSAANSESTPESNGDSASINSHQEFEKKSLSVNALMLAYRNIAIETDDIRQANIFEIKIKSDIERAKNHYENNNDAAGRKILDQAYAQVKNAIVQLLDGKTLVKSRSADEQYEVTLSDPKHLNDRNKLAKVIESLMVAYKRVSEEKGKQDQANVLENIINRIKVNADKHFSSNNYAYGNDLMIGAYTLVKAALVALREGDTLTQSLNFANDEEEYQYYVRKTESQKTAIQFLLKINDAPAKSRMLDNLLTVSQRWIDEAAALAEQNKHNAANPIMDKAFTRLQSGLMMSLSSQ